MSARENAEEIELGKEYYFHQLLLGATRYEKMLYGCNDFGTCHDPKRAVSGTHTYPTMWANQQI